MTVRDLIRGLKLLPPDANVVFQTGGLDVQLDTRATYAMTERGIHQPDGEGGWARVWSADSPAHPEYPGGPTAEYTDND